MVFLLVVHRRGDENTEALIRRFKKKIQKTGVLLLARKKRFHEKEKSKGEAKKDAIAKSRIREDREHMKKVGLLGVKKF